MKRTERERGVLFGKRVEPREAESNSPAWLCCGQRKNIPVAKFCLCVVLSLWCAFASELLTMSSMPS